MCGGRDGAVKHLSGDTTLCRMTGMTLPHTVTPSIRKYRPLRAALNCEALLALDVHVCIGLPSEAFMPEPHSHRDVPPPWYNPESSAPPMDA